MITSGSVVQEHRLKKEKIRKEYLDSGEFPKSQSNHMKLSEEIRNRNKKE